MKKMFLFLLLCANFISHGQVHKDLDGDKIKDFVYIDTASYKIVCKLSTQKFKPIYSKEIDMDGQTAEVRATKSGFEYNLGFMRAGYAYQFRYDFKTKRIQLIGMSRYEFGPASNDGSGTSSVNLLTNDYVGEWNHYDERRHKLIKMPVIKAKMYFKKEYLEDYPSGSGSIYMDKCVAMYEKQKKLMDK